MATSLNSVIQASDWLKGCGFQSIYKSMLLIGPVITLIIITGSEQGGKKCSNGGTLKIPNFAGKISQ